MNHKTLTRKFIIITAVILLMALVWSCRSKNQSQDKPFTWNRDTPLTYLSYRSPTDARTQNVRSATSKKWGLSYKSVGGCIVTGKLADSVYHHNRKVNDAMNARFGKNWEKQYIKDYQQELARQNKAMTLLNKEPLIIKKRKQLTKEYTDIQIYLIPRSTPTLYDAYISCYENRGENPRYIQVYQYEVDIDKPTVKLLNDKVKPL